MALTDNLISFYEFQGNALDSHGTNHGTGFGAFGAASPPGYYTTGKIGQAFCMSPGNIVITAFDGWYDSYIAIPAINLGTTWSFSAWVNFSGPAQVADDVLMNSMVVNGFRANIGSKIQALVPGAATLSSSTTITTGWHQVGISSDGSNIWFYYDGMPDGSHSAPGQTALTVDRILGSSFDRSSRTAAVDQMGVWNRKLSDGEFNALRNGGSGLTYPLTIPNFPVTFIDGEINNIARPDIPSQKFNHLGGNAPIISGAFNSGFN